MTNASTIVPSAGPVRQRNAQRVAFGCILPFMGVFAVVGAGGFIAMFLRPALALAPRRRLGADACVILSSELKTLPGSGDDPTTYSIDIRYRYVFNDHAYTSDRYSFTGGSSNINVAGKEAAVRRYPAGAKAVCYVDPRHPAEAVIETGFGAESLFGLVPLAFYFIGAAGCAYWLVGRPRAPLVKDCRAIAQPWLWRQDWAAGRVVHSPRPGERFAWLLALAWALPSVPVVMYLNPLALQPGRRILLIGAIVPGLELLLLWAAVKATRRRRRFGDSVFELGALPGEIGGRLLGILRLDRPPESRCAFDFRLRCINRTTKGSGEDRITTEKTLWEGNRSVQSELSGEVPVEFSIPAACLPTSVVAGDEILWRLDASAETERGRYKGQFEVPVFLVSVAPEQAEAARAAGQREPAPYREPGSKIVVRDTAGGKEFYFPPGRNRGPIILLAIVLVFWPVTAFIFRLTTTGLMGGIIDFVFVGVIAFVFAAIGALVTVLALRSALGRSRVRIERGVVTVTGGVLFISRRRRFAAAEIARIETAVTFSINNTAYSAVQIVLRSGKRITAGDAIESAAEARWLAAEMAGAAGVKPWDEAPEASNLGTQRRDAGGAKRPV